MSNVLTKKGLTFAAIGSLLLAGLTGVMPANAVTATLANLTANSGSNFVSIGHSGVKIDTQISNGGSGVRAGEDDSLILEFDVITTNSAAYTTAQLSELFQNGTLIATLNGSALSTGEISFTSNTITLSRTISQDTDTATNCGGGSAACNNSTNVEGDWDLGLYVRADDTHNTIELQVKGPRLIDTNVNNATDDVVNTSTANVKLYDKSQVTGSTVMTQVEVGKPLIASLTLTPFDINTHFVTTDVAGAAFAYAAFFDTNSELRDDASIFSGFDGVATDDDEDHADVLYAPVSGAAAAAWEANATNITLGIQKNYPLIATTVHDVPPVTVNTSLNLSARSWYGKTSDNADAFTPSTQAVPTDFYQWLGARSTSVAVTAGNNASVAGVYPFVVDSKDVIGKLVTVDGSGVPQQLSAGEALVRSGVKTVSFNAQITQADSTGASGDVDLLQDDLAASGVSVRLTFTPTIGASGVLTVPGVADPFATGSKSIILRTDAKGQVKVDLTNSAALAGDNVAVKVEVRAVDGTWVPAAAPAATYNLVWATPTVVDFDVSTNNTSAESVSLTYTAYDQWYEGISSIGTGANNSLSVTVVGLDNNGGAFVKSALNETKALVNGSATFTFANTAALNTFVSYAGMLHLNAFTSANLTGPSSAAIYSLPNYTTYYGSTFVVRPAYEVTKVYKNAATDEVAGVENEYANRVVYMDFKPGVYGSTDREFNKWHDTYGPGSGKYLATLVPATTGAGEFITVTGSVRTVGNAGAAYQAVTVSGAGTYFAVGSSRITYSVGSATVTTDANGNFSFTVFSHKENLAGLPITVTSGGKSFTTLLKTYMSQDISAGEYWNGSAWVDAAVLTTNWSKVTGNAPALNTIYNVKATVRDVWGNVLRGNGATTGAAIKFTNGYALVSLVGGTISSATPPLGITGRTNANGQIEFKVRTFTGNAVSNGPFAFGAELDGYTYNIGNPLVTGYNFDISSATAFDSGLFAVASDGFVGKQASARAGVKKGVVVATVNNAKGKTVRVYVAGKLRKTVVADKTNFVTRVKGIKAGDKRVTVKVGKQRLFSGFISVK